MTKFDPEKRMKTNIVRQTNAKGGVKVFRGNKHYSLCGIACTDNTYLNKLPLMYPFSSIYPQYQYTMNLNLLQPREQYNYDLTQIKSKKPLPLPLQNSLPSKLTTIKTHYHQNYTL
jgi:hypothetical protein